MYKHADRMKTNTINIDDIDWEDVLLRLHAFTRSWVTSKYWPRGPGTTVFHAGKNIDDYVYEAIGRFLKEPHKFNARKGELVDYLSWNIVRSLVGKDVRLEENKTNTDVVTFIDDSEDTEQVSTNYIDRIFPIAEGYFGQQIDHDKILAYIENKIQGNTILEEIFLGRYDGMKRREIIEQCQMSGPEYDNGIKRLTTILNKVREELNLEGTMI